MPRKKVSFAIGNIELFAYFIFKNIEILSGQGVVQIKPNWYAVSPVYVDSRTKTIFAIACLGKKLVLQSEISSYSLILFSKIKKFYRVKEMFKSNQTWYAVSPVYVESRTKRIFAIACLGKKLVSQSEISSYSLILFSKI